MLLCDPLVRESQQSQARQARVGSQRVPIRRVGIFVLLLVTTTTGRLMAAGTWQRAHGNRRMACRCMAAGACRIRVSERLLKHFVVRVVELKDGTSAYIHFCTVGRGQRACADRRPTLPSNTLQRAHVSRRMACRRIAAGACRIRLSDRVF